MPKGPQTVDEYYERISKDLVGLARAIRKMVGKNAPQLQERLYMGIPAWCADRPCLYLADFTQHVNLGFPKGASLSDPTRLLEGSGKNLRHVKIRSIADVKSPALAALVARAAAFEPK